MTVRTIAREDVATVPPDATVDAVVETMIDGGVGSVIVVDGDRPVGVVTDRDVVIRVHGADVDADELVASDVMSDDLVTAPGDATIYELLRLMAEGGVRRVPVVDEEDLAGIVTLDDVLLLLGMEMQSVAQLIRAESPPFEIPATRLYDE